MWITVSFIAFLFALVIWSRQNIGKRVLYALSSVEKDTPIEMNIAIREVIGYCSRKNIKFTQAKDHIVVEFDDKVVTVEQKGNYRLGNTVFFVR